MNHYVALLFTAITVIFTCRIAPAQAANPEDPIFSIFPSSTAPAHVDVPSTFELMDSFRPWESISNWNSELHEEDVFHAELRHVSTHERSWILRVGKGGQIYSLVSPWGETLPPQTPEAPWNDEVWQTTVLSSDLLDFDPPLKGYANDFMHQSGMYGHKDMDPALTKSFYSPLLDSTYDEKSRSYSVVSWPQIPTPSINRSEALIYACYRDLGAGGIELTYVVHNFGVHTLNDITVPWGGVRTSVFPEQVLSKADGGYQYYTPFNYGLKDSNLSVAQTGGWVARVKNASDPNSPALGLFFGTDCHWAEQDSLHKAGQPFYQFDHTIYGCGDARGGKRDYSVMAVALRVHIPPGGTFWMRDYLMIGTLNEMAARADELVKNVNYGPLDFDAATAPLLAVYTKTLPDGQTTLTRVKEGDSHPLFYTYAVPVSGTQPLFLMQEVATGHNFISTDPYALCGKKPFVDPYPIGNPKHDLYENRVIYQPYDGKTKWLELLGYVASRANAKQNDRYVSLADFSQAKALFPPSDTSTDLLVLKISSQ